MAIQNFLSGGYYGKLGATVGQRWKNKRTIRTYVIPKNPRTDIQQANRSKFSDAVGYAQIGLQMNYYATCFQAESYTHWNYRMKTARELKNRGLLNLDLIPLYPITFTPPTLISEITRSGTTGQNHITFAAPSLSLSSDRVLSMMFDLYSSSGSHLGLKLYVGYYYASNPGYIEVDVDDVSEINDNCFCRIVSNDDEDSAVDLIASPSLQVQVPSIDIREFNANISSFTKDATGITVIFEEPWKSGATVNAISASVSFVSSGEIVSTSVANAALTENNGFCSLFFPYATSDNQHLPAFPSSSSLSISSVEFSGTDWQYTDTDVEKSLADSDLSRSINVEPTFNSTDTGAITIVWDFKTVTENTTTNLQMCCSGRLDARTLVSQAFTVSLNGTQTRYVANGGYASYPMRQSGDRVIIPAITVTLNGVTYSTAQKEVAVRNAITTSPFIQSGTKTYEREGGTNGDELIQMICTITLSGATVQSAASGTVGFIRSVSPSQGVDTCVADSSEYEFDLSGSSPAVILTSYFEGVDHADEVDGSWFVNYGTGSIIYGGITYTLNYSGFPFLVAGYSQL